MSNPYRGRPTRARVDTTAGYGLQNQNSWNSMTPQVPSNVPQSNVFHPQAAGLNQPKQAEDPWDWGSDNANNGNDSWNWSVDQQPEPQFHSQQQQQNQFISYPQKQTPPAQDNYYKSLNGNNRSLVNQHSTSGRNTPRTNLSRESTPNHTDPYPSYQNYTLNQQLPPVQRPSSTKSNSSLSDQWSNDKSPYSPQSLPPQASSNYNWNERQSVSLQNWQNKSKGPGYWQESSTETSTENQWIHQSAQQVTSQQVGSQQVTSQQPGQSLNPQKPIQQLTPQQLSHQSIQQQTSTHQSPPGQQLTPQSGPHLTPPQLAHQSIQQQTPPQQSLHQQTPPPQFIHQQSPQSLHQQNPQSLHQQSSQSVHQQSPQSLLQQNPQSVYQQTPQSAHQQILPQQTVQLIQSQQSIHQQTPQLHLQNSPLQSTHQSVVHHQSHSSVHQQSQQSVHQQSQQSVLQPPSQQPLQQIPSQQSALQQTQQSIQQTQHSIHQQSPQQSVDQQSPQQSVSLQPQSHHLQGYSSPNESEYSRNWSIEQVDHREQRNWSTQNNQWQNSESLNFSGNWHRPENPWQEVAQNETQPWIQQTDNTGVLKESDNETNRISASEWQQIRPSAHFASSNASTTSGSTANISNITEQTEERKKSPMTPATSSTSLNDSTNLSSGQSKTKTSFSAQDSLQDQENIELDWNADGEWASELSSGLSQININSSAVRNSEKSDQASNEVTDSVPDNVPVLSEVEAETSREGSKKLQDVQETQDVSNAQGGAKGLETVTQTGYDQWYNQSTSVTQDNNWYGNERINARPQKWTPEQNVENYENIQQNSEFMNLEVVAPESQEKDLYRSRESINQETLDDPKAAASSSKESSTSRDFKQETNVEVPSQMNQQPFQPEQAPDNYEFASNDRNTFLETGELTDSHEEHETIPLSQDDENDEVPNDIPFLREVPGQSSVDPRRNDPTGQEQYVARISDPRRNDPSGQEQIQNRSVPDRGERRDVPSGQERSIPLMQRVDSDIMERRNDPSGRERSLPPQQSRNDPSGEERSLSQIQVPLEPSESREIPGRGNETEEPIQQNDSDLRQILGGASPNESIPPIDDRSRVVTGSQEVMSTAPSTTLQETVNESRIKREEAVGASMGEGKRPTRSQNRRDSFEDGDDEQSTNSREESRERLREGSAERKRFEYERKGQYYDREREYDDDYYYERRRGDYDRPYNSREDLDRRDGSFRDEDRRHSSRDDLDRHGREEPDRRIRPKGDLEERDGRRRIDDHRRDREDLRRRDRQGRDYDPRYPKDREYSDRDRRRDDRRPRRFDDYDPREAYRRDYYDDPYNRTSRPSSRSSYNDRDRDYYLRSRDPYYGYNGYGAGYDYGSNYNNNYYLYLENLRCTNPAAYSEWYHKYYASQRQQQHPARGSANYPEDRASVHSGRSSCDDRTTSEKRNLGEISTLEDQTIASSRLTPTKFSTAHVKGSFSIGSLLHVHPAYPADGERAKIDIFRVDNLLQNDPIARELRTYPGPLIKQVGVTHKKTIIEYCENKIKKAASNNDMVDGASYILLYQLMIMLIQQNGNVVGVDIAALLLRNKDAYPYNKNQRELVRRESTISQRSAGSGEDGNVRDTVTPPEKEENTKQGKTTSQLTDEFRNTLLHGLVQEALEFAMDEGLWGHALFLASKLDKRTHASVMTRFANSLPSNDPLQTLYQLHSGRVPASVTCVADATWDDWRPHLAMIISNTSQNPEVNHRSITILGDTLAARGDISAAHFCYILAQSDFGPYGSNGVKLVLIGSNHNKPYSEFINNDAIMLTEIYEYARNLSEPGFTIVDLQSFKFHLALKMVDYGFIEKALLYIEQVAVNIANQPSKYKKSFINEVYSLGNRIKFHDPVCKDSIEDVGNLTWLYKLEEIVNKYQSGEIIHDNYASQSTLDLQSTSQSHYDQHWNQQQSQREYNEAPVSMMEVPAAEQQHSEWLTSHPAVVQEPYNIADHPDQYAGSNMDSGHYQQNQQQDYWNQQNYNQQDYTTPDYGQPDWQQQYPSDQPGVDNNQHQGNWNYEPQPQISLGPSAGKQYDPLEELDALDAPKQVAKAASEIKKAPEKSAEKKNSSSGSSWFGGLFSKLAPKPKNQMILPDDNNPSIVWDSSAGKWVNKEDGEEQSSGTVGPPPKASDLGFQSLPPETNAASQQLIPPSSQNDESMAVNSSNLITGSNVYKLQKSRSMRSNYIDVMNPNGGKNSGVQSSLSTPVNSPMAPMASSSPQVFVPTPVNDPNAPMDFLTPTSIPNQQTADNPPQELSRWSSTSSLSREVQSYTMRDPRLLLRDKGPMMFNPMDLKDRSQKNAPRSRYPPR